MQEFSTSTLPTVTPKRLPGLKELINLSPENFFELITQLADGADNQFALRLALEAAISSYARFNWITYQENQLQAKLSDDPKTKILEAPLDRISVVSACMNRNEHLIQTLPGWLKVRNFSEFIIVDFGSHEPVKISLQNNGINDPRIKVIRKEADKWCLAEAFNTGFWSATLPYIIKLDADTVIRGNAYKSLRLSYSQFKTGNWRTFENNYLNGVVLAKRDAIITVGGYNEQIRRYGWDDCDFYERLSELSLVKDDLCESDFASIEHSDDARVANNDDLAKSRKIDTLIQGNRVITNLLPKWTNKLVREHRFSEFSNKDAKKLEALTDLSYQIAEIQAKYLYSEDDNYRYSHMLDEVHSLINGGIRQKRGLSEHRKDTKELKTNQTSKNLVLLTTLYEDKSEVRQNEMIRTLRKNAGRFTKIIILYEAPDNTNNAKGRVGNEIDRLRAIGEHDLTSAIVEIINITDRPTYRDFFSIAREHRSAGEEAWYIIANSDIYFDHTITALDQLSDDNSLLLCLSRWDKVDPVHNPGPHFTRYLDEDDAEWSLIQADTDKSTIPNFLSADAWIFQEEPSNWEDYDYCLGTYFCDSFFANRAFLSDHRVINPCLSIRCFHLHSPEYNSSATKFTDKETLNKLYSAEQKRLLGENPVAGIAWCSLSGYERNWTEKKPYRWIDQQRALDLGVVTNALSAIALVEIMLKATEDSMAKIFVLTNEDPETIKAANIVHDFIKWLNNDRLVLIISPSASRQLKFSRVADEIKEAASYARTNRSLNPLLNALANHQGIIFANDLSDLTHLDLQIITQQHQLYSASFLSQYGPIAWMPQIAKESSMAASIDKEWGNNTRTKLETRFSLFASLFKASHFLPRMLENFEAIASLGPCELILIDVTPDDSDQTIIESFIQSSPFGSSVNYHRLDNDPGIYACWMKGIELAKSELVSNLNADDRRSAIHPHIMADFLNKNPSIDVTFTALKPTYVANRSWYESLEETVWFDWYDQGKQFTLGDFLVERDGVYCSQNVAHCMPMWRKSLHGTIGAIREDIYGSSADWAFWLECMKQGHKLALADNNPWGLYYINPNSHNRRNDQQGILENKIISDYYGITQLEFVQQ